METVIYVVIATFIVLAIIKNLIDSAVETVRKNTAQQFKDFTREVEYMFERHLDRHQKVMTEKQNDLTAKMGSLLEDSSVNDVLLYDVATWGIVCQGISTSAVQRHFSVGFSRAGRIVDQLYGLGVCGPAQATGVRPMLISMAELDLMKRSSVFS